MTSEELADALANFRIIAPEFSEVPDEEVEARLNFVEDLAGRRAFGNLWTKAIACLAAHFIALDAVLTAGGGSAGGGMSSGALVREREGDLERSYAAPASDASFSSADNPDVLYDKTLYGRLFLQLRKMCVVPVTIRTGMWFDGRCY